MKEHRTEHNMEIISTQEHRAEHRTKENIYYSFTPDWFNQLDTILMVRLCVGDEVTKRKIYE